MQTFAIERAWTMTLRELGVAPRAVLQRAGLATDLLARPEARVTAEQYFALFDALTEVVDEEHLGLAVGRSIRAEMFSAPLFAGLCCPDLSTAAERLAHYKRLIGPCRMEVERLDGDLRLTFRPVGRLAFPPQFAVFELAFWTHFARMATQVDVRPVEVVAPFAGEGAFAAPAYTEFFGRSLSVGSQPAIRFREIDARRPFLTHDEGMWSFFEPELRRRLSEVAADATITERVRACLLELLPSGRTGMGEVAQCLGVSTRTLQRRLRGEQTSFQDLLADTRSELAQHYLAASTMGGAEISFLLGYEDPNSFYRAFHQWTGQTPEAARAKLRASGDGNDAKLRA